MATIRDNLLVVRMTDRERAAVDQLAKFEKMPTSTMVRRLLLVSAEARGIVAFPENSNGGSKVDARAAAAAA